MVNGVNGLLGPRVRKPVVVEDIIKKEFVTTQSQLIMANSAHLTVPLILNLKAVIRSIAQVHLYNLI